jgi:hypothetical protein
VILRPLAEGDGLELRRIRETPEVARWWGPLEEAFPFGDEPESTRLTIEVDGAVAGLVQYHEASSATWSRSAAITASRSTLRSTTRPRSGPMKRSAFGGWCDA